VRRLATLMAAIAVGGSLVAASAGAATADSAGPAVSTGATGSSATVVTTSSTAPSGTVGSDATSAIVKPLTASGCHTYDYWSGAHVCITVYGSGLNVQSVSGETDGPDTDWGKLYDTAGVITVWGHPTNHYLNLSWASGGGIWLANGDNFCFSDTTLGQTACVTIHT
jgi:hypothetical protein